MSHPIRPKRVVLRVSDIARSRAFYRDVVGLQPAGDTSLKAPGGDEVLVELTQADTPGPAPRAATGLFHTAFLFRDRAALGAALRRVARAGVDLTGASHHLVSEALYLDDPDGHGIELYRDLPREDWPAGDPPDVYAIDSIPLDVASLLDEDDIGQDATGAVIGHVHLKVSELAPTVDFWSQTIGLELMARMGEQAAFLASGGYHHHVGANTWYSAGRDAEPAAGPGLDAVVLAAPRDGEHVTPDGVRIVLEREA